MLAWKPRSRPRMPGLSWFSAGPEAPVVLLWIMARTPVDLLAGVSREAGVLLAGDLQPHRSVAGHLQPCWCRVSR